jgi:hypothetical protein
VVSSALDARHARDCRKQTVTSGNFRTSVIARGLASSGRLPDAVNDLADGERLGWPERSHL